MRRIHRPLLAASALILAGCPEDDLQETHARIEVCARADAPAAECNRALALGDLPLTVARRVTLFVRNAGDGDLVIDGATPEDALVVNVVTRPQRVTPGGMEVLELDVTPDVLGPDSNTLTIQNNDDEQGTLRIRIEWNGTPKPVPQIELCPSGAPVCSRDVVVDFGVVRRSQRESRTVTVRNAGTAQLQISGVVRTDGSSTPDELALVTSTRAGFLAPGASAPLTVVYEPLDGTADTLTVLFNSDDPAGGVATLRVSGASTENLPPTADARQASTMETLVQVAVGDVVALDGAASADPEGDPLRFAWVLSSPATSQSALSDPEAGRVTFVPDRAGSYRVELTVQDSLGQSSSPAGLVLVEARPRHAIRATLRWDNGGDVDLHLVPQGELVFSALDCHFGNPRPEWGDTGSTEDDPALLTDSETAPGVEDIVIVAPQAGTYALYAHLFDGAAPAEVNASVVFNDSGAPALQVTQVLPAVCSLWHIGDVVFPSSTINPGAAQPAQQCR